MMVSFIQSNYMGGSGVVADGVSLQNRAATFVLEPATRTASARASVPTRPSSRASSRARAKPVMSFGVMGGTCRPQGTRR